jgi:hypothetical protein
MARRDHDLRAFLQKSGGDSAADALASSGDDHDLARHIDVHGDLWYAAKRALGFPGQQG